jgi:2-octaprenyl-6-methoxyphenol hydroxylase
MRRIDRRQRSRYGFLMTRTASPDLIPTDLLVVGGGPVGLTAALAAAQAGFSTLVVDSGALSAIAGGDSRAYAAAPSSMRLWRALGLESVLAPLGEPIWRMTVSDAAPDGRILSGGASWRLDFDAADQAADAQGQAAPLAHMLENRALLAALLDAARANPAVTLREHGRIVSLDPVPGGVAAGLADGGSVRAKLVVGADGRGSAVRRLAGIDVTGWDYDQTAIAATIAHAEPHGGVAHDLFLRGGPLGVLPLQGRRSSIVWCEKPAAAKTLLALDPAAFCAELEQRLGGLLGALTLEGDRAAFPLRLQIAHRMMASRVALVGDAAHAIHPLAGQGLNIGLRDVAALAETIADAAALGLDIGSETALERYERWRRFDNLSYAAGMDGFNRLFGPAPAPLRWLRAAGIGVADTLGIARRFFVREAAGEAGDPPRLLRGESLTRAA